MLRPFSTEKTAQAAAVLLKAANGNRMRHIRLLKLLYLADRESIRDTGFPITGDDAYAMMHGPVLSKTYDLIKGKGADAAVWTQWIRKVGRWDVQLAADPGWRKLSRYEMRKLGEVAKRYAGAGDWEIVDRLHEELPEWRSAYRHDDSSHRISEADILAAVGRGDQVQDVLAEARAHLEFAESSGAPACSTNSQRSPV
jgi:uncharacterized phage-associated protein